ncbi:unnamed protein product, partial [Mycena citricolor]
STSSSFTPFHIITAVKPEMSYSREWDQGKGSWNSGSHWNGSSVHMREDDYAGDGKRRKTMGGYDSSQGYSDYGYDAAPFGERGAGGAPPKKRLQPSEPSPHVIFLGLDLDFTEADV